MLTVAKDDAGGAPASQHWASSSRALECRAAYLTWRARWPWRWIPPNLRTFIFDRVGIRWGLRFIATWKHYARFVGGPPPASPAFESALKRFMGEWSSPEPSEEFRVALTAHELEVDAHRWWRRDRSLAGEPMPGVTSPDLWRARRPIRPVMKGRI